MDIFSFLTLVGGLCIFLFGMGLMGDALERRAGGSLKLILEKLTTGKMAGLLTGLIVTGIIQSSSATTVMVVGFVNSGIMTLKQAINVIMGANIGTTVTAWLLSLTGISGDSLFLQLLKPSSFTPVLALIGIILYMFMNDSKHKDTGTILLGFATLMFGMETMSHAVAGLANLPEFRNLLLLFENPILGVLAGTVLTAIIQSSSASVGILQALSLSGQVTYAAAIPIIMGQNIGTTVTALISSVGTNRNAKRAAIVHLFFNLIGTVVWLSVFVIIKHLVAPAILSENASIFGIAIAHSGFNILCTILLFPLTGMLDKIAHLILPDKKVPEKAPLVDERLMVTPSIALEKCREAAAYMAALAVGVLQDSLSCLTTGDLSLAGAIREREATTDTYEDELCTYLIRLSSKHISDRDSVAAAELIKQIGDYERIADHGLNILDSCEEIAIRHLSFTHTAEKEMDVLLAAVTEIMDTTYRAFTNKDTEMALRVEPLEQVIDGLRDQLRNDHIIRLQRGHCSMESGFVWSEILTNLERAADHCSNIARSVLGAEGVWDGSYESLRHYKDESDVFKNCYASYAKKYQLENMMSFE